MIKKIIFKNYKAFKEEQTLELRPVTLLVGKNSSGKTSLCNLIHLLSDSLTMRIDEELMLDQNRDAFVKAGSSLFHRGDFTSLKISAVNDKDVTLTVDYVHAGGKTYISELACKNLKDEVRHFFDAESRKDINNSLRGAMKKVGIDINQFTYSVNHILPLRHSGIGVMQRMPYEVKDVRGDGQLAYDMLANSYIQETSLYPNVSKWFLDNLEGQEINVSDLIVSHDKKYYLFTVTPYQISIEDVGQGVQQVLPIIVETYNENASDITIIEQPALHLHPAAHAAVMRRIAESAKQLKRHFVVESHSENILLELRRMVSDPNVDLEPDDVIVYYIDMIDGVSYLKPINISKDGELSFWPSGVFSEGFEILSKIMNNRS